MIQVILSQGEMETLKKMAQWRYEYARGNGIKDEQVGPQTSDETDFVGLCAEFAFCKHYNIYPDMCVTIAKPYDCVLNDKTIDVKGTKYTTGKLLLRKTEDHLPCDYYVLVTGEPPRMVIRGYLSAREFLCDERIGKLKPTSPDSYIATQEQLHDLSCEARKESAPDEVCG